jgi:NAD(P)-dependent dehydrogenase (short-subunit alcohol dehydrogenase family)
MHWTAADIGNLHGRVAVVTGATSGLGLVTAAALARANATVVLATRDADRTDAVMADLRTEVAGARVDHVPLDLASLDSIGRAAARLHDMHGRVDLLVNNAGIMNAPLRRTEDGFELHFGVNHLGHFAFTGRIIDMMADANDPRVVTVSSNAARIGRLRLDDPNWESGRYNALLAYGQSKLANQVFAIELHRRLRTARSTIASLAAHPGHAATNLSVTGNGLRGGIAARLGSAVFRAADRLTAQDAATGAQAQLFAATAPVAASGHYYGPDGRFGRKGPVAEVPLAPEARSREDGRRLWELSEALTGVVFPLEGGVAPPRAGVA